MVDVAMSKQRIPLKAAEGLAAKVVAKLAPGCERIEVAGSIRRRKEFVGDIEIVCIPKRDADLVGGVGASALDAILARLVWEARLRPAGADGENYKKFEFCKVAGLQLDLFITNRDCWGVIFAIRTGSADFSRRLVTTQMHGGLLPNDCRVKDGRVWANEDEMGAWGLLETPEEFDVLEICGGWREPWERH